MFYGFDLLETPTSLVSNPLCIHEKEEGDQEKSYNPSTATVRRKEMESLATRTLNAPKPNHVPSRGSNFRQTLHHPMNHVSSIKVNLVHQRVLGCTALESLQIQDLLSLVTSSLEIGGGATRVEVLGKDWLEKRSEDNLSTRSLGKSHPEDENEFEGIVEWEPVDGVDSTFKDV